MRLLIIIPAYNEEQNIERVINSISKINTNWDILVVNDGSTDNTFNFAINTKKATVLRLPFNLGIGGCVQTGFKYAYRNNYEIAVQFDGDGQHDANEIGKLIKVLKTENADIVIGSRFCKTSKGFKSTFSRRIGIKLFELINYMLISKKIKDSTSGFRAYSKKAIKIVEKIYAEDFPEPEAIVLISKANLKIKEVGIRMHERKFGKSSITPALSIYYMIKVIISMCLTKIRKEY